MAVAVRLAGSGALGPAATAAPAGSADSVKAVAGFNVPGATLVIAPRLGALPGSKQSKATNTITGNQATAGPAGAGGAGGSAFAGAGGSMAARGGVIPGKAGKAGTAGMGIGGGLDLIAGGHATIDNTTVTGNHASTSDNDVAGTFST